MAAYDVDSKEISIHALREEGDAALLKPFVWPLIFLSTPSARRATPKECDRISIAKISIHALREEGDSLADNARQAEEEFLSTPSARRATGYHIPAVTIVYNFYPRPPRGGRQNCLPVVLLR